MTPSLNKGYVSHYKRWPADPYAFSSRGSEFKRNRVFAVAIFYRARTGLRNAYAVQG